MEDQLLERGIVLRNDSSTRLCPPLVVTKDECDYVVKTLAECFDGLGKQLGTVGTQVAIG